MRRPFTQDEIERLAALLDELISEGGRGSARTVVWIACSVTRTQENLGSELQAQLAELAGRAARRASSPSLASLAVELLDPILWAVGRGDMSMRPENYEHLNEIRHALRGLTARHGL